VHQATATVFYVVTAVSVFLEYYDLQIIVESILPESCWSKSLRADRIGERLNGCQLLLLLLLQMKS